MTRRNAYRWWLSAAFALLAGCERRPDSGPVVVSAIGTHPEARPGADLPSRLLVDAIGQGLVRFDAAGQIEPGLAERWIVIDGGTSYIFRLREAYWADGKRVTAEQVVRLIQRRIASPANPLSPFLTAVDEAVVMTPQVIELRLKRPRLDLLKIFAQPEMALIRPAPAIGSGPMRIASAGTAPLLQPAFDPGLADPEDQAEVAPEDRVHLIGERAARAILRFARSKSDLVSGGRFVDWPLLATVDLPRNAARIDPAAGLFGLAVTRREGFLADPRHRAALSEAIDRAALTAALNPRWEPIDRILPEALDSAAPPQVPEWLLLTLEQRRAAARALVAAWAGIAAGEAAGGLVTVSIALPAGPGSTILFGQIAASFGTIGVGTTRVAADAPADLTLIDEVAPYDSARWYLATACRPCALTAVAALEAARDAATLGARSEGIAAADAAMNADVAFIPLAQPLRWSLVSNRLAAWAPNARAWHPLNRLRADPK